MLVRILLFKADGLPSLSIILILSISGHGHQTVIFLGLLWYFAIAVVIFDSSLLQIGCITVTIQGVGLFLHHSEHVLLQLIKFGALIDHNFKDIVHVW